jgi:pseudomonalisin
MKNAFDRMWTHTLTPPTIRLAPAIAAVAIAAFGGMPLHAQTYAKGQSARPLLTEPIDTRQVQALPNHHPLWANPAEDTGAVPADLALNLTLVLARSPQQEAAFEQFLADQHNPASPNYHRWLAPAQVGERFGLAEDDIETLTNWLVAQGLHVNWVAPSRVFIGFGGTATDIGRAFQTELHYYNVNGEQRMSVTSDPLIPQAVLPAIKAIRGLYSVEENPLHYARAVNSTSPELGGGSSFDLGPSDFNTIYDVPSSLTGAGVTVGIVGESRTDFADFANFRSMTGATFANPTEIIPTAYGGVDPGAAATTCCSPPPSQGEATLDVDRVGSVAPASPILLVVATAASGGIDDAMQYLVNTTPLPAQVMSISWGGCELNGGSGTDSYYSTLFQTAAGEGISVFVSSGDSGASACDQAFTTPPASPQANSINFICASGYATCVGGTEFNDASDYAAYWNTSTGAALGYIPEGAWNESWNGSTSSVAASGGGVSLYIATPSWQTGTGVPAGRTGRYTPDVAFSAANHDGYFGCFAAGGGSCVVTDGSYSFEIFSGTSAAAPGMAGAAALLDQKTGSAQGDLNPVIYALAASVPAAFHDVTVASSGVSSCSVNTASMCNNSIPGPSGLTGGQAGFLVTNGYDEVTGLGSLDVATLIADWNKAFTSSTALTATPASINSSQSTTLKATVTGGTRTGYVGTAPAVTGSVTFKAGSTVVGSCTLSSGTCSTSVPASSLQSGANSMTAIFGGSGTYPSSTSSIVTVTVTSSSKITPTVTVTPGQSSINTAQSLSVGVAVGGGSGNPTPTGSVTLSSGSYTSAATTLTSGSATINVPAGKLAVGDDTLTATYTPDSGSSSTYNSATGTAPVTVSQAIGSCTTANPNPNPNPESFAAVGDFNGDCKSDILWRNSTTEQVYIWLMNGTTFASNGSPGNPTSDWVIQSVGDFNGDGKADILWRNSTTGEVYIWLMNGTTMTSNGSLGTITSDWSIAGVGDLNGDGKADIVWQNSTTGQIYIWLMNGTTIASSESVATVSSGWNIQGIGDFNGDGKSDILWRNSTTGEVYVWLMNGSTIASGGSLGNISSDWSIQGVGDFNGDGKSDILWRNSTTGQVYIWLMNGTAMESNGSPGTITSDWVIQGVGDYDGSGRAGILWRNSTTEQVYIWLMNGTTMTSNGSPGTPDASWQIAP